MTLLNNEILCLDDDPLALAQLQEVMTSINLSIVPKYFGSINKAISYFNDSPTAFVLTDLRLGTSTGLEVIRKMKHISSDTRYMLLSGQADLQSALSAMNELGVYKFFTKPADLNEIEAALSHALEEKNLQFTNSIAMSQSVTAFGYLHLPLVSIDLNGRLLYSNEWGHSYLNESQYFYLDKFDIIRCKTRDQNIKFKKFLDGFTPTNAERCKKKIFRVKCDEDGKALVLHGFYNENAKNPYINLLICDPHKEELSTPEEISAALDISMSEARVVHGLLLSGSISEASNKCGVSLSTARTYLKNVFAKTGVSKQGELIKLVMSTAA